MALILQRYIVLVVILMPFFTSILLDTTLFNISPESIKTVWGVFGVSTALLVWLYSQLDESRLSIKRSIFYIPIFSFIVWSFISLFWVEEGYSAIITLTQYTSYGLIFFLVINAFPDFKSSELILKLLVISMTLVSIIGLLQYYFYEDRLIQTFFSITTSMGSTFGNKNMASHFVVMTLPLSFIYLVISSNKKNIVLYSITTFIGLWFIMFASARQAYVAIALELFILIVFFALDFFKYRKKSFLSSITLNRTKLSALVVVILSLYLVSNLTNQGWDFDNSTKIKRAQTINFEGGSTRLPAWLNTIEMIKDHPILGVGVGQWSQAYPKYYDRVSKDVIFNERTKLNRLHNDYLEIFSNVGLIGFLILLWLLFIIITKVWGILINQMHNYRMQTLGIALGLAGFSVVAFFSFPVRVYLPAFLVMLYISLISLISDTDLKDKLVVKINKRGFLISLLTLSAIIIYLNKTSLEWLSAESYRGSALFLGKDEKLWGLAEPVILKSLTLNPWHPMSYTIAGVAKFQIGKTEEAIQYYKKSIDISPFNTEVLIKLATAYNKLGDFNMEKKVLDFALRIDKKNVKAAARLIPILLREKAFNDLNIVYSNLKYNFEYFRSRPNFGPYHDDVVAAASIIGDYKYARFIYEDAIDKGHKNDDLYIRIGTLEFYYLDNKKEGVSWYKKALKLNPNINNKDKIIKLIDEYESIAKQ